jgi:hypothetical protein
MKYVIYRCPSCGKRSTVPEARSGERVTCACKERLRIPKKSGDAWKDKRLVDRLVEFAVYGVGGGLLGFLFALFVLTRLFMVYLRAGTSDGLYLIAGCTVAGLLLGGLGGEPAINWIGRQIRSREQG